MRRLSHTSSTAFTASRILQEGDNFAGQALAMVRAVESQHEADALQQARELNNLLLQVRVRDWRMLYHTHLVDHLAHHLGVWATF